MSITLQGLPPAIEEVKVDNIEFGIDTFGDLPRDDRGEIVSYAEAIRRGVAEGGPPGAGGIDAVAVGGAHRPEFSISAPETVLAGIATQTERIHLASGVTVLSSDDPVRVFQRFATVDALSRGRAEVILGRGSFTESFPLFGYDLRDYEVLFDEKIDLFVKLLDEKPVTWEGTTRAALRDADVFPKTESGRLTTWVGVGGSPESVVRTARHGLRLMLAIIGGAPARFAPYTEPYPRGGRGGAPPPRPPRAAPPPTRSECTRLGSSLRPTRKPESSSTPATRRSGTVSGPCAAGRRCAARNSMPRSSTVRSTSAPRKQSPAR